MLLELIAITLEGWIVCTEPGVVCSAWDGSNMLDDMNFKYVKVITAEGRNILDGPVDRDGDGLVYDGTAREKPAPTVNSTP